MGTILSDFLWGCFMYKFKVVYCDTVPRLLHAWPTVLQLYYVHCLRQVLGCVNDIYCVDFRPYSLPAFTLVMHVTLHTFIIRNVLQCYDSNSAIKPILDKYYIMTQQLFSTYRTRQKLVLHLSLKSWARSWVCKFNVDKTVRLCSGRSSF